MEGNGRDLFRGPMPGVCLEGMKKTAMKDIEDNWYPG